MELRSTCYENTLKPELLNDEDSQFRSMYKQNKNSTCVCYGYVNGTLINFNAYCSVRENICAAETETPFKN